MDPNTGLLRYNALEDAIVKDQNASRSQETAFPWKAEDTILCAENKITDFLDSLCRH